MASGTKPIFVIFIIFSILSLLFINTAAVAARSALKPDKPVCGGPKGKPCTPGQPYRRGCRNYYECPPPASNNVATRPNIKTNN
ncbi:hypothetical protein IHE45_17G021800 [Dioscorea alata]|uniref:Uncharacterized protein n=2 Tax=Dioscorea alata TaxID=55571 RepID=A0ACB7UB03_DIOAL|nr:hypothetical protein IHE45_17G021500 [Dioscorea alata]KAH7657430.1 hypothetical protein IHE45_17G021800 [Dioscorea alata]